MMRKKSHSSDSSPSLNTTAVAVDTTLPRALAVLLVTNSHLEAFYPLSFLADGGLIGLALFFAASGFGLAMSPRTRSTSFGTWMWRRLKRIYPAVLLTVLLLGVGANGFWRTWVAADYVKQFIYPTQYHFVAKIVAFYPIVFLVLRLGARVNRYVLTPFLLIAIALAAWPDVRELYANPVPLRTGQLAPPVPVADFSGNDVIRSGPRDSTEEASRKCE